MYTTIKKILVVFLLVCAAVAPLGCVTVNSPDKKPATEVNVGGDHGVTVDHDKDAK